MADPINLPRFGQEVGIPTLLYFLYFLLGCMLRWWCDWYSSARSESWKEQHDIIAGLLCRTPTPKDQRTKKNYVLFLKISRDMFLMMWIVSWILAFRFGWKPFLLWGEATFFDPGHPENLKGGGRFVFLYVGTLLFGIIALVSMERIESRVHVERSMSNELVERTLWLTELPREDAKTGVPFELTQSELEGVEKELREQLTKEITKQENRNFVLENLGIELGNREVCDTFNTPLLYADDGQVIYNRMIESVHVAPIINDELAFQMNVIQEEQLMDAYKMLAEKSRCLKPVYNWLYRKHEDKFKKATSDLQALKDRDKYQMSGSAFVTFRMQVRRDVMLRQKPSLWMRIFNNRTYTFWNFGQVPFASVTLRCQRAIHPADVSWTNLHITNRHRYTTFYGCFTMLTILLIIIPPLLSLITPTNKFFLNNIYPILVMLVNAFLIPIAIEQIAILARPLRISELESWQMRSNHWLLSLNTLVLPLVGLNKGFEAMWSDNHVTTSLHLLLKHGVTRAWLAGLPRLLVSSLQTSCSTNAKFFLNYVLQATFFTNGTHAWRAAQIIAPSFFRLVAITSAEKRDSLRPLVWPWGYWYAWNMGIIVIGVSLSTVMPSILLCCYLFFYVADIVDEANLDSGYCELGTDDCGSFTMHSLFMLRQFICFWWMVMGSLLFCAILDESEEDWRSDSCWIPRVYVSTAAGGLVIASIVYLLMTNIDYAKKTHDFNFELPDAEIYHWSTPITWLISLFPIMFRTCFPSISGADEVKQVPRKSTKIVPSRPRSMSSGNRRAGTKRRVTVHGRSLQFTEPEETETGRGAKLPDEPRISAVSLMPTHATDRDAWLANLEVDEEDMYQEVRWDVRKLIEHFDGDD